MALSFSGTIRRADRSDALRLHAIRKSSILTFGPEGMPQEQARDWAERRSVDWMANLIEEGEIWIYQSAEEAVGWIGIETNRIIGLYTDPECARSGIGSKLLKHAESELASRGFNEVRLEPSSNAEDFYRRRGYVSVDAKRSSEPSPMKKQIAR